MCEPLISVIVPAYNAEAFLDQCLESIVAQSYSHLEILVVDDGSTDGTGSLCDQWARRDERIRIIHQTNGGHSAARNAALDVMTGELVTMVDSDDILHPEFAATLLEVMRHTDADIAVGDYIPFYHDFPDFPDAVEGEAIRRFNRHEAIQAVLYQQGLTHSPWGRLFKASLFDGIRFPLGIIYEDLAIIYPLLCRCSLVVSIKRKLYGYRQHESNSMRVFSPRRTAVLDVCEQLEEQMRNEAPQHLKAARSRLLSAYFNILLLSHQDKNTTYSQVQDRCWQGIKRLRWQCLLDPMVRTKNKIGILISYLGRFFLCSIVGRNYRPRP